VAVQGLLAGVDGALDEGVDEGLELGAEELEVDVLGTGSVHANEWEVDLRLSGRRKLNLGLLSSLTVTLNDRGVAGEIDTGILPHNSNRSHHPWGSDSG